MNASATTTAFDVTEPTEVPYVPGGQQAIATLRNCTVCPSDSGQTHAMARKAINVMRAHVIEHCEGHSMSIDGVVQSSGHGLEESSAFVHYFPDVVGEAEQGMATTETGTVYADIFTCGETVDPYVGIQHLREVFGAASVHVLYRSRGNSKSVPSLRIVLGADGKMEYASNDGESLLGPVVSEEGADAILEEDFAA